MAKQLTVPRSAVAGMSKKERQQFVREIQRAERERQIRAKRVRRVVGVSVGAVVLVGIAGAVTVSIVIANTASPSTASAATVGPANMITDGLLVTAAGDGSNIQTVKSAALADGQKPTTNASTFATNGQLPVQLYVDPTSPSAAQFWGANVNAIGAATTSGQISLEFHPFAVDTSNGTAIESVAAFGCVANSAPNSALGMLDGLLQATYTNTPAPLSTVASTAGVTDQAALACIDQGQYAGWATSASQRVAAGIPYAKDPVNPASGIVAIANGSVYTGSLTDEAAFSTFLGEVRTAATASK